ncbi:ribosomal RNA-processing protein 8-like [Mya arenaria]|nr:ribosomal RNA-processing protein 8-like [Mya arenaria]XP_052793579.1 ribosomal RNA-processing protein 8-like [Mya arenaria]
MDFECESWDVSGEAEQLASNLFEKSAQRLNKAKKRKHRDVASSDHPAVVGANTVMGSKKEKIKNDSTAQTGIVKTENKNHEMNKNSSVKTKIGINPGLKLGKSTGKRYVEDTGDKSGCSPEKKMKKKKNDHNGINKKSSEDGDTSTKDDTNAHLSMPSQGKMKKKKQKKINEMEASSDEKQKDASKNSNSLNSSQETSQVNHLETESTEHNSSKTKRKRKCKKNKFKDYSKDNSQTNSGSESTLKLSVQENLEKSETKDAIKDKDASAHSKTVNGSSEPKKPKKKKKKNVDKNEGISKPVDTTGSQSGKTKPKFDIVKLNALLSAKGQGAQSSSNKSENIEGKFSKNISHNESDKRITEANMKESKSGEKTLLEKSRDRLSAARFRYLNEQLYTSTGKEALDLFKKDRDAFSVYHEGFQGQVEKWPTNPVDIIIKQIKSKPKKLVIADFGCGDAKIAQSVANKVHSFDLVALNDHVTVCDMSKVPLDPGSVDIAVFCLSLMGTNLSSYLREANRILKHSGTLLVAEVTSRFDNPGRFVLQVEKMGFKVRKQDNSNKMFVLMDFMKTSPVKSGNTEDIKLKPCVYKKR